MQIKYFALDLFDFLSDLYIKSWVLFGFASDLAIDLSNIATVILVEIGAKLKKTFSLSPFWVRKSDNYIKNAIKICREGKD